MFKKLKWSKFLSLLGSESGFLNVAGGETVAKLIGSGFWLLLASIMVVEDYGYLHYFLSLATFVSIISLMGLRPAVITYLAKGEVEMQKQANLLVLFSTVFCGIILFIFIKNIPTVVLLMGLSFFTMTVAGVLGKRNYRKFFFLVVGNSITLVSLSIVLFYLVGYEGVILGYGLSLILFSYSFFRSFGGIQIKFSTLRTKIHFIKYSYLIAILGVGSIHLDKLLIGPLFGFELLGLYQLGFQFFSLLHRLLLVVEEIET